LFNNYILCEVGEEYRNIEFVASGEMKEIVIGFFSAEIPSVD